MSIETSQTEMQREKKQKGAECLRTVGKLQKM